MEVGFQGFSLLCRLSYRFDTEIVLRTSSAGHAIGEMFSRLGRGGDIRPPSRDPEEIDSELSGGTGGAEEVAVGNEVCVVNKHRKLGFAPAGSEQEFLPRPTAIQGTESTLAARALSDRKVRLEFRLLEKKNAILRAVCNEETT